jgi:hypothetical protein
MEKRRIASELLRIAREILSSKKIVVKFVPDSGCYLNGRLSDLGISDFVDYVRKMIKKDKDLVILGDKYSLGESGVSDKYSKEPFALMNVRGDIKDGDYSMVSLWDKHWDKIIGWGRYK